MGKILISHRGNVDERNVDKENSPEYIDEAIKLGYNVEVDLWHFTGMNFFLGHDDATYEISMEWLLQRSDFLWIHCKNVEALEKVSSTSLNFFWHEMDTMTITSKGYIWVLIGKQPVNNSIAVLPLANEDVSQCLGICSDNISRYKN